MITRALSAALIVLGIFSCSLSEETPEAPVATAEVWTIALQPDSTYSIESQQIGVVEAFAMEGFVRLELTVEGLTPNYRHAVHLHMGTCEAPGHHWNQGNTDNYCETANLGNAWARPKAGDVGNINTDASGNGTLVIESEFWAVGTGDSSDILGTVVVIHADPENFDRECFENHMHMHSNSKIACGVIAAE